jgi:hypothetical protein
VHGASLHVRWHRLNLVLFVQEQATTYSLAASQSVGGLPGSIGLETEKALIRFSARISRIAEDGAAESWSRL